MTLNERISEIISTEGLNAKQFAERAGIKPSTISNMMNGRNNPSLDVMQRILSAFPDISSDWLICGKGPMSRTANDENTSSSAVVTSNIHVATNKIAEEPISDSPAARTIERIMIFYSDGTYEER